MVDFPRRIRIRTGEHRYDPHIDCEGTPLEVTAATIRITPEGAVASLECLDPELAVEAEVVDLERLEAAEEVARRAGSLLARFRDSGGDLFWLPGALRGLERAFTAWRERTGEH